MQRIDIRYFNGTGKQKNSTCIASFGSPIFQYKDNIFAWILVQHTVLNRGQRDLMLHYDALLQLFREEMLVLP